MGTAKKFPYDHPRPTTLRKIRIAVKGTKHGAAGAFARFLDISPNRWYNYENGVKMPDYMEDVILDRVTWLGRSARPYLRDQVTECLSPTALIQLGLVPAKHRPGHADDSRHKAGGTKGS